jgi:hypothetical protein
VEAQMATYRAYFLDSQKHIYDSRDFDAADEEEAMQTAKQWVDGHAIEIWLDHILIGTIKPTHR